MSPGVSTPPGIPQRHWPRASRSTSRDASLASVVSHEPPNPTSRARTNSSRLPRSPWHSESFVGNPFATVDAMAYQSRDVLSLMEKDAGVTLAALRVDGGASVNNALLQCQADLLDVTVRRPMVAETTALGAAYLAGLAVGYWRDLDDIAGNWALDREFTPQMDPGRRQSLTRGWDRAVERSLKWIEPA